MTKIGLDAHDRGVRIVSAFLRDAGMEVIYTGPWQKISEVVKIAQEEDVDVIGISSLASDHVLVPKLVEALREANLGHVGVVLGGTIPEDDDRWLREAGVDMITRPGATSNEIVQGILEIAARTRAQGRHH
jgi:methylmalonyl-CoA mutase C-terminal domain/subunit